MLVQGDAPWTVYLMVKASDHLQSEKYALAVLISAWASMAWSCSVWRKARTNPSLFYCLIAMQRGGGSGKGQRRRRMTILPKTV